MLASFDQCLLEKTKKIDHCDYFSISGGVMASEYAWKLSSSSNIRFDATSYEYSISILCRALKVDDAVKRLEEMKLNKYIEKDCSSYHESLVICHFSIARAYIFLGKNESASKHLNFALDSTKKAVKLLKSYNSSAGWNEKQSVAGGKRAWRKKGNELNDNRTSSNTMFRTHRLDELRRDVESLQKMVTKTNETINKNRIVNSLVTRFLYFSGGGSTTQCNTLLTPNKKDNIKRIRIQMIHSIWINFGLMVLLNASLKQKNECTSQEYKIKSQLSRKDIKSIRSATLSNFEELFDLKGFVDFQHVFNNRKNIHIELGAGSGDWIISQAIENQNDNYVAVELRADRIYQTFSKALLSNETVSNLCFVGGDCTSFLQQHIQPDSISSIYVNHPEPPTQIYSKQNGDEPPHMLNFSTIRAIAKSLKKNGDGKLIIITDNLCYARLLCNSILKLNKEGVIFEQIKVPLNEFYTYESFNNSSYDQVILLKGYPCEAIGHCNAQNHHFEGKSYFDRLWRTGIGKKYAEVEKRYIIALKTSAVFTDENQISLVVQKFWQNQKVTN